MYNAAVIGVTGYGAVHYRYLMQEVLAGRVRLIGAVIINPEAAAPKLDELKTVGCRLFFSAEEMFCALKGQIDLCCIPVGIPFHAELVVKALEAGADVYVEKPLCATLEQVQLIRTAEAKTGHTVTVGFQLCWSRSVQNLHTRLKEGEFGSIRSLRTIGLGTRTNEYYQRNIWGGKLHLPDGTPVFDSPFNNAMAHQLEMGLFLSDAQVESVTAQLFRARQIEGCDTAILRISQKNDTPFLFVCSHASDRNIESELILECEKAKITWNYQTILIQKKSGAHESLQNDPDEILYKKIFSDFYYRFSTGKMPEFFCSTELAMQQVKCASFANQAVIRTFCTTQEKDDCIIVPGLADALQKIYDTFPTQNRTDALPPVKPS